MNQLAWRSLLFRVARALIGVIGATLWETDVPLFGRLATGALAGEAAGLLIEGAVAFRPRWPGHLG